MADTLLDTATVAAQFVDLTRGFNPGQWRNLNRLLNEEEMAVFFEILVAAGFTPKLMVTGRIRDDTCINELCPFKVVDHTGEDHHLATGWLERAFQRVHADKDEDHGKIVEAIRREVERSVLLKLI